MSVDLGGQEITVSNDALIVTETNSKGIIIFAGKDFCKISGYSKEELVGQPHNMVRHNFMPGAAFSDLWETVKSGKDWKGIVINKAKNGDHYWVKANVYPSVSPNGETKYISVRIKPSKEEIAEAIKLYPTL